VSKVSYTSVVKSCVEKEIARNAKISGLLIVLQEVQVIYRASHLLRPSNVFRIVLESYKHTIVYKPIVQTYNKSCCFGYVIEELGVGEMVTADDVR